MQRITWNDLPGNVRTALEAELGSAVTDVTTQQGGYSPCLAATARLASGVRVFIKAVSPDQNPDSPDLVRDEVRAVGQLPASVPAARLLAAYDDGAWVAGVFEHIEGRLPKVPWLSTDLATALSSLAEVNATEAPVGLRPAEDRLTPAFDGWHRLAEARPDAQGWWVPRIAQLMQLESEALEAVRGDRLVHADVRADNILFERSQTVRFVDWAYACAGAGWLDLILWLPALELEGGGPPERVLARWSSTFRVPSGPELTSVVAACAGYYIHRGTLPDPPGLPTLRAFQRAQGSTALAWLARVLGGD